jgi:peptide/nickel transport system permease protein
MTKLLISRGFQAIFTLWLVSMVVFGSVHLSGDPAMAMTPQGASAEDIAVMKKKWGLDQPLPVQYGRWLAGVLQGDLGTGIRHNLPVWELIQPRLVNSIKLGAVSMLFAIAVAVPLATVAALNRGTIWDRSAMAFGLAGQALPTFWVGLLLVMFISVRLRLLPVAGSGTWQHYVLPAFTMSLYMSAGIMRLLRSALLEVLDSEFVKLARAKGVSEFWVIWKHAMRNALIPVVTFSGFMLGTAIASAISIETVFVYPGIGLLTFEALHDRDFPLIQAIVMISSSIMILLNFLVDVAYGLLDPRIRNQ